MIPIQTFPKIIENVNIEPPINPNKLDIKFFIIIKKKAELLSVPIKQFLTNGQSDLFDDISIVDTCPF